MFLDMTHRRCAGPDRPVFALASGIIASLLLWNSAVGRDYYLAPPNAGTGGTPTNNTPYSPIP
jgi:hypothetical protein